MTWIEDTTFYTFYEVLTYLENEGFPPPSLPSVSAVPSLTWVVAWLTSSTSPFDRSTLPFLTYSGGSYSLNSDAQEVLNRIQLRRGYDYALFVSKPVLPFQPVEPITEPEFQNKLEIFLQNLVSILTETYDYYHEVLGAYATQKAHLLDRVGSSSGVTTKYNDTPQEGGDYTGDPYISSITNVAGTTEEDRDTPMARLHEIEVLYRDVLDDWARRFDQLFILRSNIE